MQFMISSIQGYRIHATDAAVGTLSDVLFEDETWTIQWLVVQIGSWPTHRKILLYPAAVLAVDNEQKTMAVRLAKAEIEASLPLDRHEPVSEQTRLRRRRADETRVVRGNCYSGESWPASTVTTSPFIRTHSGDPTATTMPASSSDRHLRSVGAVTGYRVHATDGDIGHVEDFLVDEDDWAVHYLIVDTRNWWFGKHVLLSPQTVTEVRWADREIWLKVGRDQVQAGPAWAPVARIGKSDDHPRHRHAGWPDYDFRLIDGE